MRGLTAPIAIVGAAVMVAGAWLWSQQRLCVPELNWLSDEDMANAIYARHTGFPGQTLTWTDRQSWRFVRGSSETFPVLVVGSAMGGEMAFAKSSANNTFGAGRGMTFWDGDQTAWAAEVEPCGGVMEIWN